MPSDKLCLKKCLACLLWGNHSTQVEVRGYFPPCVQKSKKSGGPPAAVRPW